MKKLNCQNLIAQKLKITHVQVSHTNLEPGSVKIYKACYWPKIYLYWLLSITDQFYECSKRLDYLKILIFVEIVNL